MLNKNVCYAFHGMCAERNGDQELAAILATLAKANSSMHNLQALFGHLTLDVIILTVLYSLAGLGIAIVNDFKSIEGDRCDACSASMMHHVACSDCLAESSTSSCVGAC